MTVGRTGLVLVSVPAFGFVSMFRPTGTFADVEPARVQPEPPRVRRRNGRCHGRVQYIASDLDAIASNPHAWAKTAFILTYDENDGMFDHVPPPVAPPGTPGEYVDGKPIGRGFRVPTIVVSPWSRGGLVNSDTFDHSSLLRLLERRGGGADQRLAATRVRRPHQHVPVRVAVVVPG